MADAWFLGKWHSTSVDNFDEFMKTLGVNIVLRKASSFATTYYDISHDGDRFTLKWNIAFKSGEVKFHWNEEYEETTPDGRPVKTVATLEGAKFISIQRGKPYDTTITRTLEADGTMLEVCEANGVVSTRKYIKTN